MSETNAMTKAQIINIVAEGTGLTKVETAAVIDGFLATTSWAVNTGKRVTLRSFGSFHPVRRNARMTRNPQTGEMITVPAHRSVVFRPSKDWRREMQKVTQNG